jgi:integrase
MSNGRRLTKRIVDQLPSHTTAWDTDVRGFAVRRQRRDAIFNLKFRSGAKQRVYRIGLHGSPWTVETARAEAKRLLGEVARGTDPSLLRKKMKGAPTLRDFSVQYLADISDEHKKASTAAAERRMFNLHILPVLGDRKVAEIDRTDVARLHASMKATPAMANRAMALLSHVLSVATQRGERAETTNPCRHIRKYPEVHRERFLSGDELGRLGAAIHEGETVGIPWEPAAGKKAKHAPKEENRRIPIGKSAAAALRLLLFTGARLREILHLRWENVDFDRGLLLLPDSKTGKKTIVLNAPALEILTSIDRTGEYVIAGDDPKKPRSDLKRPWTLVRDRAGLEDVRLHDLRHTFASVGASANLGLPIVGKLLGHTQAATTARYAHLESDPLRRASNAIGSQLAAALDGKNAEIVPGPMAGKPERLGITEFTN